METDSLPTVEQKPPKLRWYRPTPGRFLVFLLIIEAVLLLSEQFRWFAFNEHKGWTVLIAIACVVVAMVLMLLGFVLALCFHWRFQFSLRSLLVFTIAVAIPCSWLAVEMKRAREQKAAVEAIYHFGGKVFYQYSYCSDRSLTNLLSHEFLAESYHVHTGEEATDGDLVQLKKLKPLQGLTIESIHVTDAGLVQLQGLNQLEDLNLSGTRVTDAGLIHLQEVKQLESLWLAKTHITDAGLVHLLPLSRLKCLFLENTTVTDAGLVHLQGMHQLQGLGLDNTKVTDEGVRKLQQALPKCYIHR
jgi:hypothetical protein